MVPKRVQETTLKKLKRYPWPGNVRELQHAIERSVIMSDSPILKPTDIFFSDQKSKESESPFEDYHLDSIEKWAIRKALKKHAGNISKTAEELGLTRTSLYRRMQKHDL